MIKQLSEYVRTTVKKKGCKYFRGGSNNKKSRNMNRRGTDRIDVSEEDAQEKLFDGISNLLKPYGGYVISLFKKEMVIITNRDGVISGGIRCVLCNSDSVSEERKKRKRQELYSQFWNGDNWVVSNFAKHLFCVHPLRKQNEAEENSNCSETKSNTSSMTEVNRTSPSLDCARKNDIGISELSDKKEVTLIELQIEPVVNDFDDEFKAHFTNLKTQWTFHNMQMINTSHQNRELKAEFEVELNAGQITKIEICRIPGDGNCLFAAAVHQHFRLKIGSEEFEQKRIELRNKVVAHIEANFKLYERELQDRLYVKNRVKTKTQPSEDECKNFLRNYLSKECKWAGSESMKAIGELFRTNIIIFKEQGEADFGIPFNSMHKNILALAFRLSDQNNRNAYNHYDSIINLNDNIRETCTWKLIESYRKSCSLKELKETINIE